MASKPRRGSGTEERPVPATPGQQAAEGRREKRACRRVTHENDEQQHQQEEVTTLEITNPVVAMNQDNNDSRDHTRLLLMGNPTATAPFIAAAPARWRERYSSVCGPCFAARVACTHYPERRLRLLLIGHNPSTHAWASGCFYSNPTNRFWPLLRASGIVPKEFCPLPEGVNALAEDHGIGLTSLGCEPGSDAAEFRRPAMLHWREGLFDRLRAHASRVQAHAADQQAAAAPSSPTSGGAPHALPLQACACCPVLIAFSGKRQWTQLFEPPLKRVECGRQPATSRPPGWPFPAEQVEIWVLLSRSGRAAFSNAERGAPYWALGERLSGVPWPLPPAWALADDSAAAG